MASILSTFCYLENYQFEFDSNHYEQYHSRCWCKFGACLESLCNINTWGFCSDKYVMEQVKYVASLSSKVA